MKLATYTDKPKYKIMGSEKAYVKLKNKIGFSPVFAISAENEVDFTVQSILFNLEEPDTICFFDSSSTDKCIPVSVSALRELCSCPDKENWEDILNPKEISDTVYAVRYTTETAEESITFPLFHYRDFQIRWTEEVPEDSRLELDTFLNKLKGDTESLLDFREKDNPYSIKKAMEKSGLLTTIYRLMIDNNGEEDKFFLYQGSVEKDLQKLFKSTKSFQVKDLRRTLYNTISHMFVTEDIITKYN